MSWIRDQRTMYKGFVVLGLKVEFSRSHFLMVSKPKWSSLGLQNKRWVLDFVYYQGLTHCVVPSICPEFDILHSKLVDIEIQ